MEQLSLGFVSCLSFQHIFSLVAALIGRRRIGTDQPAEPPSFPPASNWTLSISICLSFAPNPVADARFQERMPFALVSCCDQLPERPRPRRLKAQKRSSSP